ncbi:hemin-degrading factor [Nitrosococcus watsonii]|uniref:Hemin-degrading family protein n=1 Tax=Nitrosococcus watsoni (strain C-113) TaxID=105559 RepID=D8KC00_NITWC|nr:hemin-degrading factor [Nitrosococcus watsonii]ADJ29671.1 Hemin-degrading family protein [Nitrosococcus watsonii C-113]
MLRTQWPHDQAKSKACLQSIIPRKVSEAETLAASCGDMVTRLCGLRDLLKELPQLGKVRAVTGNRHAVHEQTGQYQAIRLFDSLGRIQGGGIDLRLFLNHWHYGFAARELWDDGVRHSLQFFDRDGASVHKIHLTTESDRKAYENLVNCYRSADQRPRQAVAPVPRLLPRADEAIDVTWLREAWRELQDLRDLPALFRSFGVSRIQGLRLAGRDLATPVTLTDLRAFMEVLWETELPVIFQVDNGGAMQIHEGTIKQVESTGLWLTALDTDFTLYVQRTGIASAWLVRKSEGKDTPACLELYNWTGENVLRIFSPSLPEQGEDAIWQRLLAALESESIPAEGLLHAV